MSRKGNKQTWGVHIKRNTAGTSNELSFSVLDAAKNELDEEQRAGKKERAPLFGAISLFTLPGRKKTISTPAKEQVLHLSTGGFVSISGSDAASGGASLGEVTLEEAGGMRSTASSSLDATIGSRKGGAPGAASGGMWTSPEGEVKRRKTTRKRRRFVVYAALALALIAGFGVVGTWLYEGYTTQQSHVGNLHRALDMVKEADDTLVPLDSAVSAVLDLGEGEIPSVEKMDSYAKMGENLAEVDSSLGEAEEIARFSADGMGNSVDKEAAVQTVSAIEGRRAMIEAGSAILAAARSAVASANTAQEAWDLLLRGDSLAREAAQLVTDTNESNVQLSIEKSNEAASLFAEADNRFSDAEKEYAKADFSQYRSYLAKRIEALGYAVASNNAYLARSKEEAASQNDAYNAAEEEAAEMAEKFPDSPLPVVPDALARETEKARNDYGSARLQASSADAFLRDYLGTTGK